MSINLLEYVALHLQDAGIGKANTDTVEGDIFWGTMPDQPDNCICIFSSDSQYGGSASRGRIQIMTRAKYAADAYDKSQLIAETLAEYSGFLAGDGPNVNIGVINASQGMGADAKKRELYTSNYCIRYCCD